jgi:hypothetical protein
LTVCSYSVSAMSWGKVEAEPEVSEWLSGLESEAFGRAAFYIDLLEENGVHLDEPYSRQLRGKLRELRFYLGRQPTRISYFIGPGRVIVLLTVFEKHQRREQKEIERAERAMRKCVDEGHLERGK